MLGSDRAVLRRDRRVTPSSESRRTPGSTSPAPARPVVIKIGGRSLDAPGALEEWTAEVAALSGEVLLVHGGGRELSEWCTKLGITPRFVDGLRVTDDATLEVATAVLAGLANKRLVAALRAASVNAVGLSGVDGGVFEVEPHPDSDKLGAVGRIRSVDTSLLETLLQAGRVPVLSSIGACEGRLLNLNADEAAAAVAGALESEALLLISDTPGLELDGQRIASLDRAGLDRAIGHADVRDGMVAKLRFAREALDLGVARVRILAWSGPGSLAAGIAGTGAGTTLHGHSA